MQTYTVENPPNMLWTQFEMPSGASAVYLNDRETICLIQNRGQFFLPHIPDVSASSQVPAGAREAYGLHVQEKPACAVVFQGIGRYGYALLSWVPKEFPQTP